MSLAQIRQLMERRHIPPELIGNVEVLCIEVYEMAEKETRRKILERKKTPLDKPQATSEDEAHIKRAYEYSAYLTVSLRDLIVGEHILLKKEDYHGDPRNFYAYAHSIARKTLDYRISVRAAKEGWVIIRIA